MVADPVLMWLVVLAALIYLIFKVNRLERMLEGRSRSRGVRTIGADKVIPILKDKLEPGPFKTGNAPKKDSDEQ